MASLGSFLWIAAIGALFYYMMSKGGGCCGSGHGKDERYDVNNDQPKGGCCG